MQARVPPLPGTVTVKSPHLQRYEDYKPKARLKMSLETVQILKKLTF